MRQPGNKAEAQAGEHEQAGIRHTDAPRDLEEDRDDDELDQERAQQIHVAAIIEALAFLRG